MKKYRLYVLIVCIIAVLLYVSGLFGQPLDLFGNILSGLSVGGSYILTATLFALLLLSFSISMLSGRVKGLKVIKGSGGVLVGAVVLFVIGTIISWLFARYVKFGFNITVTYTSIAVMTLAYIWIYIRRKKRFTDSLSETAVRKSAVSTGRMKFAFTHLYSSSLVCLIGSVLFLFISGDKSVFVLTIAAIVDALILWKLIKWRGWFLLSFVTTLLLWILTVSSIIPNFLSQFDVSKYGTFLHFGAILGAAYIGCACAVSLADIYCHPDHIE